jgi:hypothetical protein
MVRKTGAKDAFEIAIYNPMNSFRLRYTEMPSITLPCDSGATQKRPTTFNF